MMTYCTCMMEGDPLVGSSTMAYCDDILCLHDDILYMNVGILCMNVGMVCSMNAIDMLEMLCMLSLKLTTPIV